MDGVTAAAPPLDPDPQAKLKKGARSGSGPNLSGIRALDTLFRSVEGVPRERD
jgi:hypothetical protein